MSCHNPLPWRVVPCDEDDRDATRVVDADGKTVCSNEDYYPHHVTLDNMVVIVHRVNLYSTLLAALKGLLTAPNEIGHPSVAAAQAAIAKAERREKKAADLTHEDK